MMRNWSRLYPWDDSLLIELTLLMVELVSVRAKLYLSDWLCSLHDLYWLVR